MKPSIQDIVRVLRPRRTVQILVAAALLAPALPATWSIVAVNTRTGEVCIASATCLEGLYLETLTPVVRVGLGGACAQSLGDSSGVIRQRINADLIAGYTPQEILDDLAANDNAHDVRQYGIVNMSDEPVTYSGIHDGVAFYGVARVIDDIRYAIQGNVLSCIQVITNAENAFLTTQGDLGQKVMAAMEGARVYGGDGRCSCIIGTTECGCPPRRFAYSAFTAFFIQARIGDVDGLTCDAQGCATGQYFCNLWSVTTWPGPEPVLDLEAQYATWRTGQAGVIDQLGTRVLAQAQRIPADGLTQITVDVDLRDLDGNPVASPSATLSIVDVSGIPAVATVGTVQTISPGRFRFPLTSTGQLGDGRWQITAHDGALDVLLWPEVEVRADPPAELFSGFMRVRASERTRVPLWLDAGTAEAGNAYLMLASASGTSPGTPFGGMQLPLNFDRILRLSYTSAGTGRFLGTAGTLDANGKAVGNFTSTPNLLYDYVGRHFDWSAIVYGATSHVTVPDGFDIVPYPSSVDLARTLLGWVDIPSVTGAEGDYGDALARALAELGLEVEKQALGPGRFNVLARAGEPRVVLCTHQDTVPPWLPPREDREFVHGRGSCDAKGAAAAMIAAARELLESREDRFGFLFTVGEETDSAGATLANERLADPWRPRSVIVGEPTGLRWVRAHKGSFKVRLTARGIAGHSSQPAGPSAVHELVGCAQRLLAESWGQDPVLGQGTLNIGRIQGGVAANVVADAAEAEVLVRVVEPIEIVRARIQRCLGPDVTLAETSKSCSPTEFEVPDLDGTGEAAAQAPVVAFGTDAPHLARWGRPMLCGPGSIRDAHTDHERVGKRELEAAASLYARAVRWSLAREEDACRNTSCRR